MINERLDSLYKDYYGDRINDIIPCGVVDEQVYLKVYPKIVFLLREPHAGKAGFTIPNGLRRNVEKGLRNERLERGYMYTWRQAGVWAYAIINGFDRYETLRKDVYVVKGLQAIGMTNLKKTGGGASSNPKQISHFAKKETTLWLKELDTMRPDIIICGNTYHDVIDNLGLEKILLVNKDRMPYYYSILYLGAVQTIILDFWHPNNRNKRNYNLSILSILIDRLKEKGLLRN